MPPKTKKKKSQDTNSNNNNSSSSGIASTMLTAFSDNTFNAITSADYSHLPTGDTTTLTNMQSTFSKVPQLPNNLTKNYVSKTSIKHAKIAYDPKTFTATILNMEGQIVETKKYNSSDSIGFILADQVMPGNLKPTAAARFDRFEEESKNDYVLEDFKGNKYTICPAHGDITKVTSLQTDHAGSAKKILEKQSTMIKELNENPILADLFITQFSLEELFVKVNNVYQGTLYFYERYYNDIDNLWNICHACNLDKKDKDPLKWFKDNHMFGRVFIDHLNKLEVNDKGFIPTAGGRGLAEIAIEWYRENHKDLIKTTKELYKDVIFKIQENLQKAASAVAAGENEKANAYNAQASLTTSLTSMTAGINFRIRIEGTTPPTSPENLQTTSDEDKEILVAKPAQINTYIDNIRKKVNPLEKEVTELLRINAREEIRQSNINVSTGSTNINNALFSKYTKKAEYHKKLFEKYRKLAEQYKSNNKNESQAADNNEILNLNNTEPHKNQDQMPLLDNNASILTGNKRKLSPDSNNNTNTNDESSKNLSTQSTRTIYGPPSLFESAIKPALSTDATFTPDSSTNTIGDVDTNNDNPSSYTSPRPGSNKNE